MLKKRLKSARESRRLTQDELAKKLNVTKGTISNYENGHSTPSNEMLKDLANVLNTTTDYLLGRTDSENPGKLEHLKTEENENLYFFNMEGLTKEDIAELEKHIEFLRFKAKQVNKDENN